MNHRIHIFGASGAGVTTLGRILAERLGCPQFDTDTYFWIPTDPPYTTTRPIPERLAMLTADLASCDQWINSGSVLDWGDSLIPRFTLAVFLYVPTEVRIERLMAREIERYGAEALAPGGRMHQQHVDFIEWASSYETATDIVRTLTNHENWLKTLPCSVMRFVGEHDPEAMAAEVLG